MAYEMEMKFLAESEAVRDSRSEAPLNDAVELRRRFPRAKDSLRQSAAAFLSKFTSVKNTTAIAADTEQYYVDDPMMDGKEYTGRYRVVSVSENPVETNPGQQGVVQVLRKGYLETLLDDAGDVDFTEARIRQNRTLQGRTATYSAINESYREVFWPNVSPFKSNAIAQELNTASYVDPVLRGETLTGTWSNLAVTVDPAEDGSVTVMMMLALPRFRLDGYSTWFTHHTEQVIYLWGIEKDSAQGIADWWKSNSGGSCTFGYSRENGMVDIVLRRPDPEDLTLSNMTADWNCRYKETVTYYFNQTDPEAHPLTTTPANGVSYSRRIEDNNDGTWDIIITTRTVQYRDSGFYDAQVEAARTVQIRQQLGLTKDAMMSPLWDSTSEVDEDGDTVYTEDEGTYVEGEIRDRRVDIRDDCSKDVTTTRDVGVAQEHTDYRVSAASTTEIEEKTVQTAELTSPPARAAGTIVRVVNRESRYPDRYDTMAETTTAIDQDVTNKIVQYGHAQKATLTTHTQAAAAVTAAAPSAGFINRVSNSPTDFGKYATSEESIEGLDQDVSSKIVQYGHAQKATLTTHTQAAAAVTASAPSAGFINRVSNSPTDFGKYATSEESIEGLDQEGDAADENYFQQAETETHTQKTAEETLPASFTEGTIVRVRNTPTEFGKYTTAKETLTAVEREWDYVARYFDTGIVEREHGRNVEDIPTITDTDGENQTLEAQYNEFGKVDYVKTTETPRIPKSCATPVSWTTRGMLMWDMVMTHLSGEVHEKSYVSAVVSYRDDTEHTISYHLTAAAAALTLAHGSPATNVEVSGSISKVSDHLWQAHKMTTTRNFLSSTPQAAPVYNVVAAGKSVPAKA